MAPTWATGAPSAIDLREVLTIVNEEALYFIPQIETKAPARSQAISQGPGKK